MCGVAARTAPVIRIDALWLATQPLDMRCGTDTALARVVQVFGAAKPHHAYLFANRRTTRMKVLVHDDICVWLCLCARRLHQGRFSWMSNSLGAQAGLTREQLDALVLGRPWQRLGEHGSITLA
jgi:transposase